MKLVLENFRIFGTRTEINFADTGVTLLSAPSGTGKTTILDAIEFVLYNSTCHTAAGNYENPKTKTTSVTLEHAGIRVKRTRRPNTVSCTFIETGTHLQEQECEQVLRRIFGFKLSDPLRDVISKMSGCDEYDVYVKGVRDYGKIQRAELQRLGGEIEGYDKILKQLPDVPRPSRENTTPRPVAIDVRTVSAHTKKLEDLYRSTRDGLSLMNFKKCALQQELRSATTIRDEERTTLMQITGTAEHVSEQLLTELTQELGSLETDHSESKSKLNDHLNAIENAWTNIASLRQQIDVATHKRTMARDDLYNLGIRPDRIHGSQSCDDSYNECDINYTEEQITKLRSAISNLKSTIAQCDRQLSQIPNECLKNVRMPNGDYDGHFNYSNYECALKEYEDSEKGLRGRLQYVKASLHSAKTQLDTAKQNFTCANLPHVKYDRDTIKQLAEDCLRNAAQMCVDQTVDEISCQDVRAPKLELTTSLIHDTVTVLKRVVNGDANNDNLVVELHEAYERYDKLDIEFASITSALIEERERIDTIRLLITAYAALCRRDASYIELAVANHALHQLPDPNIMRRVYAARETIRSSDDTLRESSCRLKAYLRKRDEVYSQCASEQARLDSLNVKHSTLLTELAILEERQNILSNIDSTTRRIEDLSNDIRQLDDEIVRVMEVASEQEKRYKSSVLEMERATVVANEIHDWDMNEVAMNAYKSHMASRERIHNELNRLQYKMRSVTFNLQGVSALLALINDAKLTSVRQTVNTVNALMATMLAEMFQDGYISAYVTECTTSKDGKMLLGVTVNGNDCKFESLSTGEAARVNLALKVAMFRVCSKQAPLCLDECFSNLDADSAKCSLDVVKSVLNTTKQPMIVTVHQCDDGMFDHVVRL
ncbi:ATPase [Heliothis virescens ascovirus 3f]|uniref:ATPase n=1 Tax=Heliothis virescens ascovirus 3f TaxID=328614 RepID=A0A171PVL6_9VIRU|nr:ATPase [Heliothis virescens ascovirus 3f]AJP09089.1 ATPase [Heliothis virescens ascovirus 3f]